ncbi:hypothetical protein Bpfe_018379, partial [Biomphalaria pfeifferi]
KDFVPLSKVIPPSPQVITAASALSVSLLVLLFLDPHVSQLHSFKRRFCFTLDIFSCNYQRKINLPKKQQKNNLVDNDSDQNRPKELSTSESFSVSSLTPQAACAHSVVSVRLEIALR